MRQRYRLSHGGRIDRDRSLRFTFDGRTYEGFQGDTLASALLANGVRIVGRSFRLHRARGLLAAGLEEPNAIVTVGRNATAETNLKATEVELCDGLIARSVNTWPSARCDFGALLSMFGSLLGPGFYYKTFMWPGWAVYEPLVRRLAGLGRATSTEDPDGYDTHHATCDVLVVGGGPAGLSAALAAGARGERVVLVDSDHEFGGQLLGADAAATIEGMPARAWLTRTLGRLRECPNVRLLARTLATGYYDHNLVTLVEQSEMRAEEARGRGAPWLRLWKLRCSRVILAAGAIERPLVFPDNDRPGVMLASALACYLNRYAVLPGHAAVVVTNNDSAYDVAEALVAHGAHPVTIVDTRPDVRAEVHSRLVSAGVRVLSGYCVLAVHGRRRVRSVTAAPCDGAGVVDRSRAVKCPAEVIGMSGGWSPTVHLFSQSGGRLAYDPVLAVFRPGTARQAVTVVGAAAAQFDLEACLAGGAAAGGGSAPRSVGAVPTTPAAAPAGQTIWRVKSAQRLAGQWVDFQNDVTADDIRMAAAEGYASAEHLKRYTTTGMAIDQGKTGNVNALGVLADCTNRSVGDIGVTTFRPPYSPVRFGVLAGRRRRQLFVPLRRLPAHECHARRGARFANYGSWLRPECYAQPGESLDSAMRREALAARDAVVLFDASPLGKIEVKGPDAATFLSRIYINDVSTLKPGAVRYGLMLGENGGIIDDGVFACLAQDHYQVCTTSAGAQRVAAWLEEWRQCEWPGLDVVTLPVTTQLGTLTVAGPLARTVLGRLVTDIDLAPSSFPHLSVRTGVIAGLEARIFRVSYTGELSYEVNVPAGHVAGLWEQLLAVGGDCGLVPMGIEALMLLRAEKGYIHVGSDTDANTVPDDIGLGHIAASRRGDFIGRRSLSTPEATRPDRWQLVGLESLDPRRPLPTGAQCLPARDARPPVRPCGRVTSSYVSPTLQRPIALALLECGRRRMGEEVHLYDLGTRHAARVRSPVFYDPEGVRLRG